MTDKQIEFAIALSSATQIVVAKIRECSATLQDEFGLDSVSSYQAILGKLRDTDNGMTPDGRAGWWRVRTYLYSDKDGYAQPLADSDPTKLLGENGDTVLISLPAVIEWVHSLATTYHDGAVILGLSKQDVATRLKSFRTQMSTRKDGTGTLRMNYQVPSGNRFKPEMQNMMARVDVTREIRSEGAQLRKANSDMQAQDWRNR